MEPISLKSLLEAGCHFGHKAERWHPRAKQYIYQERDGIHVIDLAKTKSGLERAAEFVKNTAKSGKTILFVGTKRQAAAIIKEEAEFCSAPFISRRWIGGFLTNWEQVHRNLEKIRRLTEEETNGTWKKFPKHERVKLSRYLKKLLFFYSGVVKLMQKPDAVLVVDIKRESVAIHEANIMHIPVVAMVDTNTDPTPVEYQIPANDDAVGSIRFVIHYLAQAYLEGVNEYEKEMKKAEPKNKDTSGRADIKTVKQEQSQTTKQKESKMIKKDVKKIENTEKAEKIKAPEKIKEEVKTDETVKAEVKPEVAPKKKRGKPKKIVSV